MEPFQQNRIPLNAPNYSETEIEYVLTAIKSNHRHGSGAFTAQAIATLSTLTQAKKILLTHSCTGALELAALLLNIQEGDEVIMPSFTFSSTANAIVLRGGVPVFADIDPYTQCLDPSFIPKLKTPKTKAIIPVHYAGVACDMELIFSYAQEFNLYVLEDAAQCMGSFYKGKALGSLGELGTLSFHDSKNISAGEGGAILINDKKFEERAEILWEKGTNRSQFMRGEVDKYTWCDVGSSFLPSEITAAFLLGQLEKVELINENRLLLWNRYYNAFAECEQGGYCLRPHIPKDCKHNGHIFYLILPNQITRDNFLSHMQNNGIGATFHYIPLHSSPAGKRFGQSPLPLPNTEKAGFNLVRLPIFFNMTLQQQDRILDVAYDFLMNENQRARLTKLSASL